MAKPFINEDFVLGSESARILYHDYAAKMPIYDYHCHLPADQIADDKKFDNITQLWLSGDHYKWRAMRTNGIDEKYITGDASDWQKFQAWAQTVPYTVRNPLYHWTAMELAGAFGVTKLLNADTAREVYDICNEKLQSRQYSVQGLIKKFNVKVICTTEGPLDSLEHHQKIKAGDFDVKVHTAFRPDKSLAVENLDFLNDWIDKLAEVSGVEIRKFDDLLEAIKKRHDYFGDNGCRLSDYGIETVCAEDYTQSEIESIFEKIRNKKELTLDQQLKYKSAVLYNCAMMDSLAGWVMQLHLGALRNANTRMLKTVGPDSGFDSISDVEQARPLAKFLDRLDRDNKLPKTILYNLNPSDNEVMATMIGNFQDGLVAGKLQWGSAWWFLDQKDGMEKQINSLSNLGLLSRFVGMLTDSRSFLSYPRHDYFRRILCNLIGSDIEKGLLPADYELLGKMVADISFNNAKNYFPMEAD